MLFINKGAAIKQRHLSPLLIIKRIIMKDSLLTKHELKLIWLVLIILWGIIFFIEKGMRKEKDVKSSKTITFVMGQDKVGKDYFSLAKEHFTFHPTDQTDVVTEQATTIKGVIEYINTSNKYWSEINIVAHGNAKTGLNLYLDHEGHKATPKRMVQEVLLASLPRFNTGSVDSNTTINIISCGIGSNPMISLSMKQILSTQDGQYPNVNCSEKFVVFKPGENGIVEKYSVKTWSYFFKRGYRPSDSEIEASMVAQYPNVKQNWRSSLNSSKQKTTDYHLPISYTKYYLNKNDRPNFKNEVDKKEWVLSQPEVADQLDALDLGYDDFHWQTRKIYEKNSDNDVKYAVKTVGMTTVLCFLDDLAAI